jgi:type IX secretion system PorP/SprF family membrane protein
MRRTGIHLLRKMMVVLEFSSLTGFLLLCFTLRVLAQQDPVYTQYQNNLLAVQPAYAGSTGTLNITGISRAQWIGFAGAPNTNTLTIQGPLSRYNVGLGLSIINDKWGPIRQNGVYVDYAYHVQLGEEQYLSFGIKGGANIYQAWLTDLLINDPGDDVFKYDVNMTFLPNVGAGILWHGDRFFLGASMPKFLKNRLRSPSTDNIYKEVLHFYGMGGLVFPLSEGLKFKPTVLYRWAERTPSFAEFSGTMIVADQLWFGATYRTKNSYAFIFQFSVNNQLKFGYSYDLTIFHPTQVNAGTHEFMISYDFVTTKRGRRVTPRYF